MEFCPHEHLKLRAYLRIKFLIQTRTRSFDNRSEQDVARANDRKKIEEEEEDTNSMQIAYLTLCCETHLV
jgi:hypothetical protein